MNIIGVYLSQLVCMILHCNAVWMFQYLRKNNTKSFWEESDTDSECKGDKNMYVPNKNLREIISIWKVAYKTDILDQLQYMDDTIIWKRLVLGMLAVLELTAF